MEGVSSWRRGGEFPQGPCAILEGGTRGNRLKGHGRKKEESEEKRVTSTQPKNAVAIYGKKEGRALGLVKPA